MLASDATYQRDLTPMSSCQQRGFKKFFFAVLFLLIMTLVLFCVHLAYYYFTDNVHEVIPGKIYRSGQLNEKGLTHYTKKFGLKSIINLRGSWPNNHWYVVESQFAKTNQLNYYPIQFSAYSLPTKARLRELVNLLLHVQKPLIFHCEGGADRTGMAAAISIILFDKNATMKDIMRQDSWHYNAISPRTVGYQVLRNYFEWLKVHHDQSSKAHFLEWLNSPVEMKAYMGWFLV